MADVRYCTTEDGARIAYSVEGQGPPLVVCPYLLESFSLEHLFPAQQAFMQQLGKGRLTVRFDFRGTGISQREAEDVSHEAYVRDLEAVARASGVERFALWGNLTSGPLAISYAAHHPEQVVCLILLGTYARLADIFTAEFVTSYAEMARANWDLAAQMMADLSTREEFPEQSLQEKELFKQSVSGDMMARLIVDRHASEDVTPLLPKVTMRTLVLHRIEDAGISFANAQRLAAGIPNARLVPLKGKANSPALGDSQSILDAVNAFLDEEPETRRQPPGRKEAEPQGAFRTILFTDIVGHTEMMRRLGDEAGREVLRKHERITREVLKAHGGAEVKTMGDGFMASFSSVTKAVECAIALQRAFGARNADVGAALAPPQGAASGAPTPLEPLHIRIGLNAGEPIEEDGDLFGEVVILAARIAAQAQGGEILSSLAVRELCAGKGFLFADRGEHVLRGFEDPVRVFEISSRE